MYPISLYRFSPRQLLLCLSASIFCLIFLPTIAKATTGGPDDGGYIFLDSLESSCQTTFTDISSTGEKLVRLGELNLPFPFEFYGQTWNDLYINMRGVILFGPTSSFSSSDNRSLSESGIAGPAIFPYWDNSPILSYSTDRRVYSETLGIEPDRQFILQWHTTDEDILDNGYLIFQAVFYENRDKFDFVYGDVVSGNADTDAGASATIGIQKGSDINSFLQYSYNDNTALNRGVTALCFFYDISLKNSTDFHQALLGSPITYTVQFRNSLPESLTDVMIIDELPEGFMVDKVTNSGPPIRQVNTAPYEWVVDEIPANSHIIIEIAGTIANNPILAGTTLTSTAYITGSNIIDSRPVTTDVYIPDGPNLSQSSIQASAAVGTNDLFTITVVVSNTSLLTAVDTNLTIPVPADITYVEDSITSGGIYNVDSNVFEWRGDIEPTSVVKISYTAMAPESYAAAITSTATLVQTELSTPLLLMTRTAIVPKIAKGNFCADFEDGYLPSYILTETREHESNVGTVTGLISLQSVSTYKSNYALYLETFHNNNYYTNGGTTQEAIMLLDMSEIDEEIELSFWHNRYHHHNSDIYDRGKTHISISLSDDGGRNYTYIDFYSSKYIEDAVKDDKIVINLGAIVQTYGLTLSKEFRIKFTSSSRVSSGYVGVGGGQNFASNGIALDDICITTHPPEIEVKSGTELIPDGSPIASVANNTDFGPSINGKRVEKSFTIENMADRGNLTLKEIELEGLHPEDFEVIEQPSKMILEPGDSTNFKVGFGTTNTSIRQAVIRIFNNDSDERIYNFTVQGYGVFDQNTTGIDENGEPLGDSRLYLPIIQR